MIYVAHWHCLGNYSCYRINSQGVFAPSQHSPFDSFSGNESSLCYSSILPAAVASMAFDNRIRNERNSLQTFDFSQHLEAYQSLVHLLDFHQVVEGIPYGHKVWLLPRVISYWCNINRFVAWTNFWPKKILQLPSSCTQLVLHANICEKHFDIGMLEELRSWRWDVKRELCRLSLSLTTSCFSVP